MDYLSLSNTQLFNQISANNIQQVSKCLQCHLKLFKKGEIIFSIGDSIQYLGLVVSGSVFIGNNDLWGNRSILDVIEKNQIFAESYAFSNEKLKFDVIAVEDTEILFFNTNSVVTMCENACQFRTQLIQNLLSISSSNNIRLIDRIINTSSKTIRGRLISYFSQQAYKYSSSEFKIPLNRQELADYLNVDRSALSKELCKMRDEDLLSFNKNYFKLLNINL